MKKKNIQIYLQLQFNYKLKRKRESNDLFTTSKQCTT